MPPETIAPIQGILSRWILTGQALVGSIRALAFVMPFPWKNTTSNQSRNRIGGECFRNRAPALRRQQARPAVAERTLPHGRPTPAAPRLY